MLTQVFFGACDKNKNTDLTELPELTFSTYKVTKLRYDNDLKTFGSITFKTKNDITVQVNGILVKMNIKEGDYVEKGKQIALLKNIQIELQKEQYLNELETSKAALEIAETKFQDACLAAEARLKAIEKSKLELIRQERELSEAIENFNSKKELYDIGGISESTFKALILAINSKETDIAILKKEIEISELGYRDADLLSSGYTIPEDSTQKEIALLKLNTRHAEAELSANKAAIRNAEKNLTSINRLIDELSIKAPLSGIVVALYFEQGEYIGEYQKVATIIDTSDMYAVFSIQEQDLPDFCIGNPLTLEVPSIKKTVNVKLDEISPIADKQSGNFIVKASLTNEEYSIKPGMFVKCIIPRNESYFYPAIPETCLVKSDGTQASVFCSVNGFAVLKEIEIVAQKDAFIWVSSGLSENDLVIDKPSLFLKEGARIE